MAKGIIVVDIPEKCKYCPFSVNRIGANHYCYIVESIGNYDALSHPISMDEYYSKPDWCPIKPMPERAYHENYCDGGRYDEGWNACIDEIEGSAEK